MTRRTVVALAAGMVLVSACSQAGSAQATPSPSLAKNPVPAARGYAAMVDAPGPGVLLVGGFPTPGGDFMAEVWAYDPTAAARWHQVVTDPKPAFGDTLVCLSDCRSVLFLAVNGEAWVLDAGGVMWHKKAAPAHWLPGMRAAYDSESNRVIAFGGDSFNDRPVDETFVYDPAGDTWTQMHPRASPPARYWQAMAYDAASDRVVLFGGLGNVDELNDTWTYDFNQDTWARLATVSAPTTRHYSAMVYDAAAQRLVLFGGAGAGEVALADTWRLDSKTGQWTEVKAAGPSARAWHAMAYDAAEESVVLFGGGETRNRYVNDVWLFSSSANAWSRG